jgi:hypothetical protein
MAKVVKAKNLQLNNVTFSEAKNLDIPGAKLSFININNLDKIIVQGPKLRTVSGVRRWLNKDNNKYDYDIEFAFDDKPQSQELLKKSEELDNIIKTTIKARSKEWLGKQLSDEVLNFQYKPIVKYNNGITLKTGEVKDFNPSIVLKLQVDNSKFVSSKETELLVFDENNNPVDFSVDDFSTGKNFDVHNLICGNMMIIPVYEVSFLSFTKTSIKPRLKLVQAKIFPNTSNKITGNVMEEDDESDQEPIDDLDTDNERDVVMEEVEEVEEEIEEEVEEEEVEEVEEEVKQVPKRRGRK